MSLGKCCKSSFTVIETLGKLAPPFFRREVLCNMSYVSEVFEIKRLLVEKLLFRPFFLFRGIIYIN